jgi:hypothetical protein
MDEISISGDGVEIIIKGESEHFFGQDLHTKAAVMLIEMADVGGWEKHALEHDTNPDALGEFCATVLSAVTRLYASYANLPEDELVELPPLGEVGIPQSKPVHEILNRMVEQLRAGGHLEEEISGGMGGEEPEDLN